MSVTNPQLRRIDKAGALDIAAVAHRYRHDIERWATHLGGPLIDAEDVAQEVMLVVQKRLHEFRHDAQLSTWLFKITQNIATRHRRRERFRRWVRGFPLDYARDLPDPELSAAEVMERREAAADVYAALDMLGEKYRSIVILFEIEDLSGEEIAALTGVPLATVWIRLHRGRKKFRAHYERLLEKRGEP